MQESFGWVAERPRLGSLRDSALGVVPDDVFVRLTRLASSALRVSVAFVVLLNGERQILRSCLGLPELSDAEAEVPVFLRPLCRRVATLCEPVVVDCISKPRRLSEGQEADRLYLQSFAGVPLLSADGYVLGSLCVAEHSSRTWADEEIVVLRDLAALLMPQIELHTHVRRHEREEARLTEESQVVDALNCISASLAGELDLQRLAQVVTEEATRLVGAAGGAFLYNDAAVGSETPSLCTVLADGRTTLAPFPPCRKAEVLETAFYDERVLRLDDPTRNPEFVGAVSCLGLTAGHPPARSYLAAPVVSRSGEVLGGLFFVHPKLGRFTGAAERLLAGIAAQAAVALDRARLFQEVRAAEQRYRDLIDGMDAILWEADAKTWQFTFISQRAEELLGFPVQRWLEEPRFWLDCLHPDDRERARSVGLDAVSEGRDQEFEYRMVAADGRTLWFRDIVRVVRGEDGEPRRLRGVMVNITERRRAEEALRESEERQRALLRSLPQRVFFKDCESVFVSANAQFLEDLGTGLDVAGKNDYDLFPPELADKYRADDRRVMATRQAETLEEVHLVNGQERIVEVVKAPVVSDRGEVAGVLGLYTDITERRRAQEAVQYVLGHVDCLLWHAAVEDHDGELVWTTQIFDEAAAQRFLPLEVSPGKDAYLHAWRHSKLPEETPLQAACSTSAIREGRSSYHQEFRCVGKDGHVRWLSEYAHIEQVGPGRWRLAGVCTDVTDRRRAEEALRRSEEQLRQSQKMEAVGRLAGGVAHDFNNMLAVINGYSELLLTDRSPDDPTTSGLREILKAGERAAHLTRQLLAFSRKQIVTPQVMDLGEVVGGMQEMLRRLIGEDIQIVTSTAPGLGRVKADPSQMEQVILNLAVNARDAMPEGGKLTIETRNVELDGQYALGQTHAPPGSYVVLAVSDTGMGMDSGTLARVFEPFFTTKPQGQGTGLGLAMVYGIVQQSGGHVWVYSEPGHGTTFKIYLPRIPGDKSAVGAREEPAARPGAETVLLVEDEEMVRRLVRSVLELKGYTVLEASGGEEALKIAREHDGLIELLVTDVVMPGMSGRQVAERLRPLRPETRVLFMSGYTDDVVVRHGILDQEAAFIEKPFTPVGFAQKVREVLG